MLPGNHGRGGVTGNHATKRQPTFRVHGLGFRVGVLHKDVGFERFVGQVVKVGVATVMFHKDVLTVYLKKDFLADDVDAGCMMAYDDLIRVLSRVEHDFKVVLLRNRAQNIVRFRLHVAHTDNGVAPVVHERGERLSVRASEDGRVWLWTDQSLSFEELETGHKVTAELDMGEVVAPFLNDLRDNKPMLPSEYQRFNLRLHEDQRAFTKEVGELLKGLLTVLVPKKEENVKEDGFQERPDYVG